MGKEIVLGGIVVKKELLIAGVIGGVVGSIVFFQWRKWSKKGKSTVQILGDSSSKTKKDMVDQLKKVGIITHDKVAATMLKIDRANFIPQGCPNPYKESGYPIGFNATISAPHMHALGLDLLVSYLVPGATVLDIGSGSGYMTACMANMVSPNGRVYGVEHVKELVDAATSNILNDTPALMNNITLTVGDGLIGLADHAPYNVIYVVVPQELVDQLKVGGRMVLPVGPPDGFHSLVVIDKSADGSITTKNMGPVRFIPLQAYEKQVDGSELGVTKVLKGAGANGDDVLLRTQYYPAPDTKPDDIKILKAQLRI